MTRDEGQGGMTPTRLLKAVLLALVLVGWGGVVSPAAAAPALAPIAVERDAATDESLPGCADLPGHHGHAGHDHAGHDHAGRGGHSPGDGDGTGPGHHGCCVSACGASGPALADGHGAALPRPRRGGVAAGDETMRERAVSPLRRPPKPGA